MAPLAAKTRARDPRLDIVRGLAIILVVFGHSVRGLFAAGLVTPSGALGVFNEHWVYLLHLPLFVLTTGLLIPESCDRRGPGRYVALREISLLWPFLVWTLLQGVIQVLTSGVKNQPTTWTDLVTLWRPLGQLWYLPFLMVATVIVVAVRPWQSRPRLIVGAAVAVVFTLTMWGRNGETVLTMGMGLVIFLMLGAAIGRRRLVAWWDATSLAVLALTGVASLILGSLIALATPALAPTSDGASWADIGGVGLGLLASLLLCVGVAWTVAGLHGALGDC